MFCLRDVYHLKILLQLLVFWSSVSDIRNTGKVGYLYEGVSKSFRTESITK
jgi:hypothetical protein